MANSESRERTRAILREIVNVCADEIAATHPESEPETSEDEDIAVENEHMQEVIEEIAARNEEEQEELTSRKRKIEEAIHNLEATYLKMETKKLKFRKIEEDLASARHRETMEIQKDMCKLIVNAINDAVTKCLEPRGA